MCIEITGSVFQNGVHLLEASIQVVGPGLDLGAANARVEVLRLEAKHVAVLLHGARIVFLLSEDAPQLDPGRKVGRRATEVTIEVGDGLTCLACPDQASCIFQLIRWDRWSLAHQLPVKRQGLAELAGEGCGLGIIVQSANIVRLEFVRLTQVDHGPGQIRLGGVEINCPDPVVQQKVLFEPGVDTQVLGEGLRSLLICIIPFSFFPDTLGLLGGLGRGLCCLLSTHPSGGCQKDCGAGQGKNAPPVRPFVHYFPRFARVVPVSFLNSSPRME